MKTERRIFFFSIILLIISCNEKKFEQENKDYALFFLKKIESKSLDNDIQEKYLDTACQKMKNQVNDFVAIDLYFEIAIKDCFFYVLEKYFKVAKIFYERSPKKLDSKYIAKSLCYFGNYYEFNGQLDITFSCYLQYERMCKKNNYALILNELNLCNSDILYAIISFDEVEIEGIKVFRPLSKTNNTRLFYKINVVIVLCFKELSNCQESLRYFKMILLQLQRLDGQDFSSDIIEKSEVRCCNNTETVYEEIQDYKEVIHLYKIGFQTKGLKQGHAKCSSMFLDNFEYSEMESVNHKRIKNILFKSLKILYSLQLPLSLVTTKIRILEFYLLEIDVVTSLWYFTEGLVLAKKNKSKDNNIQSLKLLIENYEIKKYFSSQLYFEDNDSIQILERKERIKFARIVCEKKKMEEKNKVLLKNNKILLLCSVFLFFILSTFLVVYLLKIRNSKFVYVQSCQDENEKIYDLMLVRQSEIENARKEERERIAMELHDGIVNSIFTTRFNLLQLTSSNIDKKAQLIQELEKTENEIRKVSHDLAKNLIYEEESLFEILRDLVTSQQNEFNTKFDLSFDKYINWSRFSGSDKVHIYRIIQEGIQNSSKYSRAERCHILLLNTDDKITIRIWDNGIGFNVKNVKNGIGLKNIKERARLLKGELKIISSLGNGTTIEVVF
ncbi:sensor histidine kinase [Flavobacterium collinsii]|uniref:Histidine kinase domain-containing protein n=1 Tax=Flavobacterium collinsii TaxID=1114861 RepID=A0ABM8KS76_9FLAO|nr:ATP-binding protein [Flavobacterium collinsii]CAA9203211.1 hypothetical protein FLACOL7796_04645 [Flavobacterium collinsii]